MAIKNSDFARLGASADGLFNQSEVVAKYTYLNKWFESTYNNPTQNTEYYHNHYKNQVLEYDDYRYLTANVPYIVAFPGERYYEYDLSGEFYNSIYPTMEAAREQTIWYVYQPVPDTGDDYSKSVATGAATGNLTIGVTDSSTRVTTVGGYSHKGTFSRITSASGILAIADDAVNSLPGKVFSAVTEVLPFRTYGTAAAAPIPASRLVIGESGGNADDEMPSDGEISLPAGLNIYLNDNVLVIESTAT